MRMLANVPQVTSKPLIQATMAPGTCLYTDAYDIYSRLEQWGDKPESVCHNEGEDARDDEGDGFHEGHVHTMEGFWSLLDHGCARIGAFHRITCLSIWAFLSLFTT